MALAMPTFSLLPRTAANTQARPLDQPLTDIRGPIRKTVILTATLVMLAVFWAVMTSISGAVISQGAVAVRGNPKSIQSLDGGIVNAIYVANGDRVKTGDPLVDLDPTLLQISLDMYRNRLAEEQARRDRLEAEQVGANAVSFAQEVHWLAGVDTSTQRAGQESIFRARKEVLAGKADQLQERIFQFQNQISGVEGLIAAKTEQQTYIDRELDSLRKLRESDLAKESQLLDAQSRKAGLLGELTEQRAELARINNSIRDAGMEILQSEREFREGVVTDLRDVTAELEETVLQIVTITKQLERVKVTAPVDGIVHEMQVFTIGGVVAPGTTMLKLIPREDGVNFELKVDPKAIDQVHTGQRTRIVFPNFNRRTTPEIFGSVGTISADAIEDTATRQSYFQVRVDIPDDELAKLGDVELMPGMPVEAYLETGDRTVFSYLVKPLADQLRRAFREHD